MAKGRLLGGLARLGRALLVLVLGLFDIVARLIVLVLVLLAVPGTGALVAKQVTSALEDQFVGQVRIDELRHIGLDGIAGARVRVLAADGRELARAEQIEIRVPLLDVARSALFGEGPIEVPVERVKISDVALLLSEDASGELELARALSPRKPSPKKPGKPGRGAEITVERFELDHAWVHGKLGQTWLDADVHDLALRLRSNREGTTVSPARVRVVARALPGGSTAELQLDAELFAPSGGLPTARLDADGVVARAPTSIRAAIAGESLAAEVIVDGLPPSSARTLVPGLELAQPASARVYAAGSLSRVGVHAELLLGSSRLDAQGTLSTRPHLEAVVELGASRLDARAVSTAAPPVRADVLASLSLAAERGSLRSELELRLRSLGSGATELPDLDLNAQLERSASGETRGNALLTVPSSRQSFVELELAQPSAKAPADARAKLRLEADTLRGLRGLPPDLAGRLELDVAARLDRAPERVFAAASMRLDGARAGGAGARRARVLAFARGVPSDPELELHARADDVESGKLRLVTARLDVTGRQSDLKLGAAVRDAAGRSAELRTGLDARQEQLEDLELRVRSQGVPLRVRANRVALRGSDVLLDGVIIDGAGRIQLEGRAGSGRTALRALGSDLDLGRIARFASLRELEGGRLSFDAAVKREAGVVSGRVIAGLEDVKLARAGRISADLEAALVDGKLELDAEADLGRAGNLLVTASNLSAPRRADTLASAREATGELYIGGKVDVAELPAEIRQMLPVDRARGVVRLALMARRTAATPAPELTMHVVGRDLAFVYPKSSAAPVESARRAKRSRPKHVQGFDFTSTVAFEPNRPEAKIDFAASDSNGPMLGAHARAPLTVFDLVGPELRRKLTGPLPIEARFNMPRRDLESLPEPLRPAGVRAELAMEARVSGTMRDPDARLELRAYEIRAGYRTEKRPVDARLVARHRARKTEIELTAAREERQILDARVRAEGSVAELASGRGVVSSARAVLEQFPLGILPGLEERQISGHASGHVTLTDLFRRARLEADVSVPDVKLGKFSGRSAKAELSIDPEGRVAGGFSITHDEGHARAALDARVKWGASPVPKLVEGAPLEATLDAKNMRAGALLPFLHQTFGELDGSIDAALKVRREGGKSQVSGNARLREGLVQIPAIGQTYREIQARVEASPDGAIAIRDMSALGLTGRIRAKADLHLDGLALSKATLEARIQEGEKIPVALEGATLGQLWGKVDASYTQSPDGKRATLRVDAQKLHIELSEKSTHKLQELEDAPRIRVGVRDEGQFRTLPIQPLEEEKEKGTDDGEGGAAEPKQMVVELRLGNDVWVHRGSGVKVQLTGQLDLDVGGEKTLARGEIRTKGGKVDVQGKMFEVDQGIITFKGEEPSNPMVVATARFDSPDGYRVYAEYRGRAKDGKLTLRADPALTQDQILSLLLFGSPEGTFGSGEGSGDGSAAAMTAAGAATKGLNRALDDLTELDITTRIDTTHGSSRPEIVLQISRRVSAELAYAPSEPAPGQPQDRTFLTLDLRLGSRISLATTAGDRGATMLDLVWQHRY